MTKITRKIRFGHVTLILALFAAFVSYYQAADGVSQSSLTLYVFAWTLIATWVSVEFYKGRLVNEKEEYRSLSEDWRATVIDFRNENEDLKQENEELRETIKDLTRENYALKQKLEENDVDVDGVDVEDLPDR